MEHPEIFTPAAYEEIIHSMQPVYGLTKGLSNKMITNLSIRFWIQGLSMGNICRRRYGNAISSQMPIMRSGLSIFRKICRSFSQPGNVSVFDEFLLFVLAIQLLKKKTEEAPNTFSMKPVWTTEEIIEGLPYDLTEAQKNVWHEIERDSERS